MYVTVRAACVSQLASVYVHTHTHTHAHTHTHTHTGGYNSGAAKNGTGERGHDGTGQDYR